MTETRNESIPFGISCSGVDVYRRVVEEGGGWEGARAHERETHGGVIFLRIARLHDLVFFSLSLSLPLMFRAFIRDQRKRDLSTDASLRFSSFFRDFANPENILYGRSGRNAEIRF